jgi:hypothetical protein
VHEEESHGLTFLAGVNEEMLLVGRRDERGAWGRLAEWELTFLSVLGLERETESVSPDGGEERRIQGTDLSNALWHIIHACRFCVSVLAVSSRSSSSDSSGERERSRLGSLCPEKEPGVPPAGCTSRAFSSGEMAIGRRRSCREAEDAEDEEDEAAKRACKSAGGYTDDWELGIVGNLYRAVYCGVSWCGRPDGNSGRGVQPDVGIE